MGDFAAVVDAGRVLTALGARLSGPAAPRALALDRAWPWRGDGLCALYLEPRGRRLQDAWAVLRPPSAGLPGLLRRALGPGGPVELPELSAVALPLTADPELFAARELLDGSAAAERLRFWLADRSPEAPVEALALRYKPLRRLTLEYRTRLRDGRPRRLFAKSLRTRDLARIESIGRELASSPAAAGLVLPAGFVRPWNLLLFEERPGTALDRLLPGPAAGRGVSMAAAALAELHGSGARLPGCHSRRAEFETAERWVRCAGRSFPELAAGLANTLRLLARAAPRLKSGRSLPGHRDFHPGQVQVTQEGVVILDLDTAAAAEPELDAGNFLAHLDLYRLARPAVPAAELARRFRTAYAERAGRELEADRLAWYRAAAALRLASVYRFRPRGAILAPRLVHRSLELLGSSGASLEVI